MRQYLILLYVTFVLAFLSFLGTVFLLIEKEWWKVDKEIKKCEEIPFEVVDARDGCFQHLAIKRMDPELCWEITGAGRYSRSQCVEEIAVRKKDPAVCEYLLPEADKDLCLRIAAERLNDIKFCEKISLSSEKDYCYFQIATKQNDWKICEKIQSRGKKFWVITREECIATIGANLDQPEICEKNLTHNADACYYWVALKSQEKKFCERIEDREVKKNCLASFE